MPISEVAVSPLAAVAAEIPAWPSMRYCSAAPAAAPPGTILLSAFPESCDVATPNQERVRSARRCRAHIETKLAISTPNMTANQPGLIDSSRGHAENTWSRLGHST